MERKPQIIIDNLEAVVPIEEQRKRIIAEADKKAAHINQHIERLKRNLRIAYQDKEMLENARKKKLRELLLAEEQGA